MDNATLTLIACFACPTAAVAFIVFVARNMDIRGLNRELGRIEKLSTSSVNTAIPKLMDYLVANNDKIRTAARDALTALGPEAVSPLIDALDGSNFWLSLNSNKGSYKRYICSALGGIGDPRAIAALARQMETKDVLLGSDAVEALRRIGTPAGQLALQTCAQSGRLGIRELAQIALLDPHDEAERKTLIGALQNGYSLARLQALRNLTGVDAPEATNLIQHIVYDPYPDNREAALAALYAAGQTPVRPSNHPLEAGRVN